MRALPYDAEDWRRLADEAKGADHCHGLVVHEGEQDACGKPAVAIIDGRGTEAETFWPACAYHANRYGRGCCVPIPTILASFQAAS